MFLTRYKNSKFSKNKQSQKCQIASNDLKRREKTSEEPVIDSVKANSRSNLKSGNLYDDNPNQGSILFQQALSST